MENRKSLATITEVQFEEANRKLFLDSLASLDPDLWLIKTSLDRYEVNPAILPIFIEMLDKVSRTGWGRVITEIQNGKVVFCEGTVFSGRINLDITSAKDYN